MLLINGTLAVFPTPVDTLPVVVVAVEALLAIAELHINWQIARDYIDISTYSMDVNIPLVIQGGYLINSTPEDVCKIKIPIWALGYIGGIAFPIAVIDHQIFKNRLCALSSSI